MGGDTVLLFIISLVISVGLETKDVDMPPVESVVCPMDSALPMFGHDMQRTEFQSR